MTKYSLFIMLFVFSINISFSQSKINKTNLDCYSENILLNIDEKTFVDTILSFRNYEKETVDKRIICNDFLVDTCIEEIIWNNKHIKVYLDYQQRLNKFSIVSFKIQDKTDTIASFYISDKDSKKTVEMVRFKIGNRKIVGKNIFPCCHDGFVPIDEFEKPEYNIQY